MERGVLIMGSMRLRCGVLAVLAIIASGCSTRSQRFSFVERHMGTSFRVVMEAEGPKQAARAARAAFQRVHELDTIMSDWDASSELSRLSRAPWGQPQEVGDDLWRVLVQAQQVARRSAGAFDISAGPLVRLWRRARRQGQLPARARLAQALQSVGYRHLKLDAAAHTVTLQKAGMALDLGGIAKGLAAQAALRVLQAEGVRRALVDAGGDLALGDAPLGEAGWLVGLPPLDDQGQPTRAVRLARTCVATSGASFRHVEIAGVRYSHIVDPRTGLGLRDSTTVSVVARDGALADALASAVSVLGPQAGLQLVASYPAAWARVLRMGSGGPKVQVSAGFPAVIEAPLADTSPTDGSASEQYHGPRIPARPTNHP